MRLSISDGLTENARPENDGLNSMTMQDPKMQDMKTQDLKLQYYVVFSVTA